MSDKKIKVGDVVVLRGWSPLMTVAQLTTEEDGSEKAGLLWYANREKRDGFGFLSDMDVDVRALKHWEP